MATIFKNGFIFAMALFFVSCGTSKKSEEIARPMPDFVEAQGKKLYKKGQGFKWGSKLGFTARVYKAGYYLENIKAKSEQLYQDNQHQMLVMRFVYDVKKSEMQDGWEEAFKVSCVKECADKNDFKRFLEMQSRMKVGHTMTLEFPPDQVIVDVKGNDKNYGTFKNPSFRANLLAIFVGPKVRDEKLKQHLLGLF